MVMVESGFCEDLVEATPPFHRASAEQVGAQRRLIPQEAHAGAGSLACCPMERGVHTGGGFLAEPVILWETLARAVHE